MPALAIVAAAGVAPTRWRNDGAATSDWAGCSGVGLVSGSGVRVRLAGDAGWQVAPTLALAWTTSPARLLIAAPADARGWRLDVLLAKEVRR